MGYAQHADRRVQRGADAALSRRAPAPAHRAPRSSVEPRIWYNPQLRSTLFLVPGLIAYISMITAVVSTALSVVREKERGTMEQVRMAPLGPLPYIIGKTLPYLVISFVSALLIVLAAMAALRPADARLVAAAVLRDRPVPDRRAGAGPADLDDRRHAAGGVPGRAAVVVPADDDPVGIHLSDLEHAGRGAVRSRTSCRRATSSSRCGRSC